MASINQLVSECANMVGQPNNIPLRRHIRENIVHIRSELLRQSFGKHGYIDKQCWQRYIVNLIDVPEGDIEGLNLGNGALRSKSKIPRSVRFNNNLPFESVRTIGDNPVAIMHTKQATNRFYKFQPVICRMPTYDTINGYLYVNTNKDERFSLIRKILVESVFEHPELINDDVNDSAESPVEDIDDNDYLLPEDMIPTIKDLLIKRNVLSVYHETNETPKDHLIK